MNQNVNQHPQPNPPPPDPGYYDKENRELEEIEREYNEKESKCTTKNV